jgi:hypothetical protein
MAHNGIPVISRLAIENVPTDLPAARLRLDVTDATGPVADSQEILLDLQAGRPTVLADLKLLLDPAAMLQVEEQRPGTIRARAGGRRHGGAAGGPGGSTPRSARWPQSSTRSSP